MFKMVGVCFWFLSITLLVYSTPLEKSKLCLDVCSCSGNYVNCGSKKFETIPKNIPKWVIHLDFRNNSIKTLEDVDWKSLSSLTSLTLNKNNIPNIPSNCFTHQKRLKILEINRNRITTINALTFKSLHDLTTLKLKKNQIMELKDGAFYGLGKIEKLILDYNFIQVINKGWLYSLNTLKELSLTNNHISRIEVDSWEFCSNLTILNLSSNKLETIEQDTFKNLGELEKLLLSNNSISYIKENAFVHLLKLKLLNISYNKIWWAVEDANGVFYGLNNLLKFELSGNNIKSINKNAFVGLKNLTYLSLAENSITSIQKNAFDEVPLLKDFIMNTTSLLCDCNIKWFLEWLKEHSFIVNVVCAYPEWLYGQSLLNVVANNFTCDELPKPRLIEEPDLEIMALKGKNISLNCKAMSSSSNNMTFQWKKNNVELPHTEVITKSRTDPEGKTTETSSELKLHFVKDSDAGTYQCVVSNTFGTTYSQKSKISVLVYPTFTKVPKNVTVQAGDTAKLECAAVGEPQPEIAWHKDGGNNFPAASERRMHVMPEDDVFFIVNAKPIDMGVYSCTAHNAAGVIVANASLIIQEKPYFIKSMEDKEVTAGELVVLQCMARGVPKPTITWMKDGETILRTERHFFTAEDQLVVIVDTVQSDSGIYECHLNNSLGKETGLSRIMVKPVTLDTSNMWGIIIISVVCCAVFTSIMWVVIIYQTRRHLSIPQVHSDDVPDLTDKSMTLSMPIQMQHFSDNISDHSSCKDSGTGDSAKRSSNDLEPDDYAIILNQMNGENGNNFHEPLLHCTQSTNHDRAPPETNEPVAASKEYFQ